MGKMRKKLQPHEIEQIRREYVPWRVTERELAKKYHVSCVTIHNIVAYEGPYRDDERPHGR